MIPALLTSTSSGPRRSSTPFEERLERGAVGHVERQRDRPAAQLRRRALGHLGVEVADRDLRALAHECDGRRAADAAGAARDRDHLAGERAGLLGHRVSSAFGNR